MEANRAIDIVLRRKLSVNIPLHKDLIFNMPCDLRISCGWDTNDTGTNPIASARSVLISPI